MENENTMMARNRITKGGARNSKNQRNANGPGSFMRRRKKIKLYKGHPSDQELIAAYMAEKAAKGEEAVIKLEPGVAIGSMQCTGLGLE